MADWSTSETNPGYIEKTITHGAATIVLLRPVLSGAAAEKAKEKARVALESVMREHYIRN